MRRILLDTSAYSLALRGEKNASGIAQVADQIGLSPIVLGELRSGFLRGNRADENEDELQKLLKSPRARIFPVDEETSHHYASLEFHLRRQGTPVAPNDLWIASTALQHRLELVTADSDFSKIPGLLLTAL